jgi:hypothetical protein
VTRDEARRELGISRATSGSAIRKAFKRLALLHHPDHNPDNPQAAERFHRICLAYEILSGARHADPSPRTNKQESPWHPPWARSREPDPSPNPLPATWPNGQPIYYPTPEEIAQLDLPRVGGSKRTAFTFLIVLFGVMGLLALLEALSGRPPEPLDPYREKMRRSLMRRW